MPGHTTARASSVSFSTRSSHDKVKLELSPDADTATQRVRHCIWPGSFRTALRNKLWSSMQPSRQSSPPCGLPFVSSSPSVAMLALAKRQQIRSPVRPFVEGPLLFYCANHSGSSHSPPRSSPCALHFRIRTDVRRHTPLPHAPSAWRGVVATVVARVAQWESDLQQMRTLHFKRRPHRRVRPGRRWNPPKDITTIDWIGPRHRARHESTISPSSLARTC